MKQQTAVDWLKNTLESFGDPVACRVEWNVLDEVFKQAKKREEDQRMTDYNMGYIDAECKVYNSSASSRTGGDERENKDKRGINLDSYTVDNEVGTLCASTTTAVVAGIISTF